MPDTTKRAIPAVHRLINDPLVAPYRSELGAGAVRSIVQSLLDSVRASDKAVPAFETIRSRAVALLAGAQAQNLVCVINGTGVLLHTNFGRAPLSRRALDAVAKLGAGYTNLEYDLEAGARGNRYDRLSSQLREVSGAQAALVINNCAAAVLLVLDTFARGREVVVSRAQLIEIGGGFRLPEVLAKSGATLVEVGTTNKTYPGDYRNAWSERTAIFMRSHPSNYRVVGFTAEVGSSDLAALARELDVISFEDLGSGALVDLRRFGLESEPTVAAEIAAGLDLVAVSGDKLLGGPQCGIIFGRTELIGRIKRNPLLRALRVDKMTLAALSSTLTSYLEPDRLEELPLFAMLAIPQERLMERACSIAARCLERKADLQIVATHTTSTTGGGTLPLAEIPSAGLALRSDDGPSELAARLRRHRPPLIGRIEDERLIIDLRTVSEAEESDLVTAIASCTS